MELRVWENLLCTAQDYSLLNHLCFLAKSAFLHLLLAVCRDALALFFVMPLILPLRIPVYIKDDHRDSEVTVKENTNKFPLPKGQESTSGFLRDYYLPQIQLKYGVQRIDVDQSFLPIQEAYVRGPARHENLDQNVKVNDRYRGRVPVMVHGVIRKEHIGKGEGTNQFENLAKIIKKRGRNDNDIKDDAGHIIGRAIGGKCADFNLFPQDREINQGHRKSYWVWRAVESTIQTWVEWIPKMVNPRVSFDMILEYGNESFPDRPEVCHCVIVFEADLGVSKVSDEFVTFFPARFEAGLV